MFNLIRTVLSNSFLSKTPKTAIGRWASVSVRQENNRAIWSSIDNCGPCGNDNFKIIEIEWILDEEEIKNAQKSLDTGQIKCEICNSFTHTTENCPETKNKKQ